MAKMYTHISHIFSLQFPTLGGINQGSMNFFHCNTVTVSSSAIKVLKEKLHVY